jgi:hypothetical protein
VEETSSHVTNKRGEEGARLQARDLDSLLGNRLRNDSVRIRILLIFQVNPDPDPALELD